MSTATSGNTQENINGVIVGVALEVGVAVMVRVVVGVKVMVGVIVGVAVITGEPYSLSGKSQDDPVNRTVRVK